jgi:hypothetical protein
VARLVPAVGWPISEVISRAMHGDREERFGSALEMRAALLAAAQQLLAGNADPISLPPVRSRAQRERDLESQVLTRESALPAEAERAVAALTRARDRGISRKRWLLLGGAALAAALVAGATLALGGLHPGGSDPVERQYIVVQGTQPAAPSATAQPSATRVATSGPTGTPAQPAGSAPQPPVPMSAERARRKPQASERSAPSTPAPPADALARAFDRQKAKVVQCLNQHADQAIERVQMSVRLSLDDQGHVQAAEMLPPAIAATPAGGCIAAAVREMRFEPQPAPISFRVPLLARRSAAP